MASGGAASPLQMATGTNESTSQPTTTQASSRQLDAPIQSATQTTGDSPVQRMVAHGVEPSVEQADEAMSSLPVDGHVQRQSAETTTPAIQRQEVSSADSAHIQREAATSPATSAESIESSDAPQSIPTPAAEVVPSGNPLTRVWRRVKEAFQPTPTVQRTAPKSDTSSTGDVPTIATPSTPAISAQTPSDEPIQRQIDTVAPPTITTSRASLEASTSDNSAENVQRLAETAETPPVSRAVESKPQQMVQPQASDAVAQRVIEAENRPKPSTSTPSVQPQQQSPQEYQPVTADLPTVDYSISQPPTAQRQTTSEPDKSENISTPPAVTQSSAKSQISRKSDDVSSVSEATPPAETSAGTPVQRDEQISSAIQAGDSSQVSPVESPVTSESTAQPVATPQVQRIQAEATPLSATMQPDVGEQPTVAQPVAPATAANAETIQRQVETAPPAQSSPQLQADTTSIQREAAPEDDGLQLKPIGEIAQTASVQRDTLSSPPSTATVPPIQREAQSADVQQKVSSETPPVIAQQQGSEATVVQQQPGVESVRRQVDDSVAPVDSVVSAETSTTQTNTPQPVTQPAQAVTDAQLEAPATPSVQRPVVDSPNISAQSQPLQHGVQPSMPTATPQRAPTAPVAQRTPQTQVEAAAIQRQASPPTIAMGVARNIAASDSVNRPIMRAPVQVARRIEQPASAPRLQPMVAQSSSSYQPTAQPQLYRQALPYAQPPVAPPAVSAPVPDAPVSPAVPNQPAYTPAIAPPEATIPAVQRTSEPSQPTTEASAAPPAPTAQGYEAPTLDSEWARLKRISDFHQARKQGVTPTAQRATVDEPIQHQPDANVPTEVIPVDAERPSSDVATEQQAPSQQVVSQPEQVQRKTAEPTPAMDWKTKRELMRKYQAEQDKQRAKESRPTVSGPKQPRKVVQRRPAQTDPLAAPIDESKEQPPIGATSLESVWPVQQKDEDMVSHVARSSAASLPRRESAVDEQVRSILNSVDQTRPASSDTKIELITPRRPRPGANVQRKVETRLQREAQPADEDDEEAETDLDMPVSAETVQRIANVTTTNDSGTMQRTSADISPTSDMVKTDIGELPSDLWTMMGKEPPTPVPIGSSNGNGSSGLVQRTTAPTAPTADNRSSAGDEVAADSAETDGESEGDEKKKDEIDIDELATQVYSQLKRRLAIEWERQNRR